MARSRAGFFPIRSVFPGLWSGRHPHCRFRGLLKLHARYGLPDCSPTYRGLCREVSISPVPRTHRSPAIESNHQLLKWVLPPLVISPFGAHQRPAAVRGLNPSTWPRSPRPAWGGHAESPAWSRSPRRRDRPAASGSQRPRPPASCIRRLEVCAAAKHPRERSDCTGTRGRLQRHGDAGIGRDGEFDQDGYNPAFPVCFMGHLPGPHCPVV